ncbi:hypothetical protein COU75_03135 [Candidatus Peregrinibacteria bacterium CG10_big_fil_rev_8_21_14_0_10_42_8]|nr:MAG: hypothetical protein COU75_03135 [Candidatus Peregrinibacteria bacterium CG10_big_fil_rev_8_21_14_0_10_42_8]
MRKFILCMMFVFPTHVFAAITTPADILLNTAFTGSPRNFKIQAHNQKNDVYYSTWIHGAEEGKGEWYKVKMDVVTHIQNGAQSTKMNTRLIVYQGMLFVAIMNDDPQWTSVPLGSMELSHGFSVLQLLSKAGIDAVNLNKGIEDALSHTERLTVTHEGYATGIAYSLKTPKIENNTHIKVNTDKANQFGYLKIYTTNGNFVAEGTVQPQASAVYIDVPTSTVSFDEFKMQLGQFRVQTVVEKPAEKMVTIQNKRAVTSRTNRIINADRSRAAPKNIPTTCVETGDINRIELERKGFCPAERFHKRIIHGSNEPGRDGRKVWQERVSAEKLIEGYNDVSVEIEEFARRKNLHKVKASISRKNLEASGSDAINTWITNEIIPFFVPTNRSWVVESILIEDEYGHNGVVLQKSATTATGKRKNFVIFLLEENKGDQPVMTDIYLNTRLSDLQAEGLID